MKKVSTNDINLTPIKFFLSDMHLPPLKSLQVFLSAAKLSSFKSAAEHLHVTQAAVSQQIRLLEKFFDEPLFIRENKQTRLNASGKLLFPFIEKAFEQINEGINTLIHEPNSNELRITALHSVTSLLLLPKIGDFQQKNKALNVQFSPSNTLDLFQEKKVDIAIRRGLGDYPGLESRKLTDDAIILVASPMLVDSSELNIKTLLSLPLLEDISSDIQEAITDFCNHFTLQPRPFNSAIKTTDALPIIQSALTGQGIAFVSKILVEEYLKSNQLINVFDYAFHSPRTLYLVAPPHHFKWDKIQRFELWLKALFN